ncbi:MAG TPA: GNAT family N-acetyltransferase [Terrimicrobiaceae bacterium]|nr:GNAT family N-acetyltransferase [Terrimicrobiaceae bacterium]
MRFFTLTLAFENNPPCRWLYPEDDQYSQCFPIFAKAFGAAAIERGTALASHDFSGVALWMPPGVGPNEEALTEFVEGSVADSRKASVFAVFAEMGRVHPSEPHWYLPLIGVNPAQQGNGIGAALLRPVLEECDRSNLPAYLEATIARRMPLYQRHGFEPVAEIRVSDCPLIMPMLRLPRSNRRV